MNRFEFPLLDRIAELAAHNEEGIATVVDDREAARARFLARAIPRPHPVRLVVDRLLQGYAPTAADIRPILPVLLNASGFRWKERYLAAWALGYAALDTQARALVSAWLVEVVRDRIGSDTGGRWLRAFLRAMVPAGVLSVFSTVGLGIVGPALFLPLALALTPLVAPFSFRTDAERRNSIRAAAVRSLGRLGMPHAIATVAAALYDSGMRRRPGRMQVRHAAEEALPALAQSLREEDRASAGPEADAILCKALGHPDDVVVFHAMHALGFLGSERALKMLQNTARRGRSPAIREAARRSAAQLREVLVRAHAAETLLRPAHAPDADPHVLLRPAEDAGSTDPALLLRPSAYEDEP
jgi:hypothetical protein